MLCVSQHCCGGAEGDKKAVAISFPSLFLSLSPPLLLREEVKQGRRRRKKREIGKETSQPNLDAVTKIYQKSKWLSFSFSDSFDDLIRLLE